MVIVVYLGILTFAYVTFALSILRMMQKFTRSMQDISSSLIDLSESVCALSTAVIEIESRVSRAGL